MTYTCAAHLLTAVENKISQNNGGAVKVERIVQSSHACDYCDATGCYGVFINIPETTVIIPK
jgi:hypothetical protein